LGGYFDFWNGYSLLGKAIFQTSEREFVRKKKRVGCIDRPTRKNMTEKM
jgi:hypothetical protein